jgi:hypothetical protein
MEQPKLENIENNNNKNFEYFRAVSNIIDPMCCVASPLSDFSDSSSMYNPLSRTPATSPY